LDEAWQDKHDIATLSSDISVSSLTSKDDLDIKTAFDETLGPERMWNSMGQSD